MASFLYFFVCGSSRLKKPLSKLEKKLEKISNKNLRKNVTIVNIFWSMQLLQILLVIFSPAVFGSSAYIGMKFAAEVTN
jgi:hypothetical protein